MPDPKDNQTPPKADNNKSATDKGVTIARKFLTELEATRRQSRAVQLRLDGYTYQQIADVLGYSNHSGARAAVKAALKKTLQEPADELRIVMCMRFDKYLEELWRRKDMIIKTDQFGCNTYLHVKSIIETALKIERQRAELLGLNIRPEPVMPEEILPEGADMAKVELEVLRERARALTLGIHDANEIKRLTGIRLREMEPGSDGGLEKPHGRIIEHKADDSKTTDA